MIFHESKHDSKVPGTSLPAGVGELAAHLKQRATAVLAGIRADGTTFITFPKPVGLSGVDESGWVFENCFERPAVHLPLRGQRWLGASSWTAPSSFPLNCGV
jgi:hypothetical protein